MRVALVTGSGRPGECGIRDYVDCLAAALPAAGVEPVRISLGEGLNPANVRASRRAISAAAADLVHLSYPLSGSGTAGIAQALSLLVPSVVTIHEASRWPVRLRYAWYPLAFRSRAFVLTNEAERAWIGRHAPWMRSRCEVIPLGSPLPAADGVDRDPRLIAWFGLLRGGSSLDRFADLVTAAREAGLGWRFRIVGATPPGKERFVAALRETLAGPDIEWTGALPPREAAAAIAGASVAYLPYEGGATESRSSLLAVLAQGTPVVTTVTRRTPASLRAGVTAAASTGSAVERISGLLSDAGSWSAASEAARRYAATLTWQAIATRQADLYRRLAGV